MGQVLHKAANSRLFSILQVSNMELRALNGQAPDDAVTCAALLMQQEGCIPNCVTLSCTCSFLFTAGNCMAHKPHQH